MFFVLAMLILVGLCILTCYQLISQIQKQKTINTQNKQISEINQQLNYYESIKENETNNQETDQPELESTT